MKTIIRGVLIAAISGALTTVVDANTAEKDPRHAGRVALIGAMIGIANWIIRSPRDAKA